jgi:predicted dehydrogenase
MEMTRVALVGAGVMGANHARLLNSLPEFDLVAVVDPDSQRGPAVAALGNAAYLKDIDDLPDDVTAVVLAAPTPLHVDMGVVLLERGLDLLIEKPIAESVSGAQRLLAAAEATQRVLMVGHIERFNPAVLELPRFLDEPLHLEFARVGPYSPRIGTDVVLDLMIHDIDLALSIADAELTSMSATGRIVMSHSLDLATALLVFTNGLTATLTASRVAQTKVRRIDITQRSSAVSVDLVRQDITINRLHHAEFLSDGIPSYRQSGLVEIPYLEHRGEPLSLELKHFAKCVRERSRPVAGAPEATKALQLALAIREAASEKAD